MCQGVIETTHLSGRTVGQITFCVSLTTPHYQWDIYPSFQLLASPMKLVLMAADGLTIQLHSPEPKGCLFGLSRDEARLSQLELMLYAEAFSLPRWNSVK